MKRRIGHILTVAIAGASAWTAGCGDDTAAGNGATTITATAGSVSGTAMVAVTQMAGTVAIAPATTELAAGNRLRMVAEATDANGHAIGRAGVTWTSTDESGATADASGLVRGVGVGIATIVAAAGGIEAAAQIRGVSRDLPVLTAFYDARDGAGWIENEGWLSDRSLGEWHGVTTEPDGRVTALRLGASDLAGPIPPKTGELSDLEMSPPRRQGRCGPPPRGCWRAAMIARASLDEPASLTVAPALGEPVAAGGELELASEVSRHRRKESLYEGVTMFSRGYL